MMKSSRLASPIGFRSDWLKSLEAAGFSLDEGHYSRSSGGKVAFLSFEAGAHAPLSILFHGTGNDLLFTWQPLIESLLHAGHSVLTFDLDGHGRDSSTQLSRETFWTATLDLQKFLEEKGWSQRPYHLVGYSLGALAALHAVHEGQLTPHKIVLLAPTLRVKLGFAFLWNELLSLGSRSFRAQWKSFGWQETVPAFGKFRRASFPLRFSAEVKESYPQFVASLLKFKAPLTLAGKLGHNCLVIHGGRDRLAPASDAKLWQEIAPDATILCIDRANHFLLPFHKQSIQAICRWMTS